MEGEIMATDSSAESAAKHAKGEIDGERYLHDIVTHFAGVSNGVEEGDEKKLDPIAKVFREWGRDYRFEPVTDVQPLKNLLRATWTGDASKVKELLRPLIKSFEFSKLSEYIYLAIARIAGHRGHTEVLEYCLSQIPLSTENVCRHYHRIDEVLTTLDFCKVPAGPAVWDVYLRMMREYTTHWPKLLSALYKVCVKKDANSGSVENTRMILEVLTEHGLEIDEKMIKTATYNPDIDIEILRCLLNHCNLDNIKPVNILRFRTAPSATEICKVELLLDTVEDLDCKPRRLPSSENNPSEKFDQYNCLGTALHHAAWYGNEELVWLLLRRDAKRDVKDRQGRTALEVAEERGHVVIMNFLNSADDGPLFLPD